MNAQERAAMQAAYDWMTSHGGVVFAGGGMQALDPMNAAALGLRQALAAPTLPRMTAPEIEEMIGNIGIYEGCYETVIVRATEKHHKVGL